MSTMHVYIYTYYVYYIEALAIAECHYLQEIHDLFA
jgi:hypothetical protein